MKFGKVKVPKGFGKLTTEGERNALAKRIKKVTNTWSKKVLRNV